MLYIAHEWLWETCKDFLPVLVGIGTGEISHCSIVVTYWWYFSIMHWMEDSYLNPIPLRFSVPLKISGGLVHLNIHFWTDGFLSWWVDLIVKPVEILRQHFLLRWWVVELWLFLVFLLWWEASFCCSWTIVLLFIWVGKISINFRNIPLFNFNVTKKLFVNFNIFHKFLCI